MDVFEAIKGRKSIRKFTNRNVDNADLRKILECATRAPSAGNIQPWEFIIVRNPEIKRKLSEAALNQSFVKEAPVVIVVLANQVQSGFGYGHRGVNLYCLQDTAAATQNMLLAAYALGLGACWVGAFHEEKARETLRTPKGMRPVAIIPVGHPAEKPRVRFKKRVSEIVHYETF